MFSYSKFNLLLMFNYFIGYQIKHKTMTMTTNVQTARQ